MAGNINFFPMGIGQLLRQGQLHVPPFQRSYAWQSKHVRNLMQDLHDAISGGNPVEDYFLGTIVIIQNEGATPAIVDGQQRLASTSIILARIRDRFLELGRSGTANSIDQAFLGHIDPRTEETVSRLQLNDEDNEFFGKSILARPDSQARPAGLRPSNRRLLRASNLVKDFIADVLKPSATEQHADILLRWHDFIDTRANVLAVYVPDEISAFRMFETLNDRGLRASQADILKNYFFSRSGSRIDEAKTMWNMMAVTIEPSVTEIDADGDDGDEEENRIDPLVTYIRHLWVTGHGATKERELAAKIRAEITNDTRTIAFLNQASGRSPNYMALSNSHHPKWATYRSTTRQYIETLANHLRVIQIKPLLFAVATHFSVDEADKAFKLFVSWSVRFLVFGGRGGMLDTQYSRRAHEVGSGQVTRARQLHENMAEYVPTDAEFEEAFAVARVSRPYLARYYLRALEKTYKGVAQPEYVANEDVADITLEHYLPLSPGPEWDANPEVAQAAQKFLGNMVLVREAQNRELGNRPPQQKRPIVANSGYELTKMIATYDKWDIESIRDRQAKLAKLAVQTWPLKFDG
jgi:hypothetical protein